MVWENKCGTAFFSIWYLFWEVATTFFNFREKWRSLLYLKISSQPSSMLQHCVFAIRVIKRTRKRFFEIAAVAECYLIMADHNDVLLSLLLTLNIFYSYFSISIVDFEQENVCRRVPSCSNFIAESLKMSRYFI